MKPLYLTDLFTILNIVRLNGSLHFKIMLLVFLFTGSIKIYE